MKSLFLTLLAAVLALGAWLLLGDPPDLVREPERRQLQIEPERFRLLGDGELARLRSAAPAAAPAAPAPAPPPPAHADTARSDNPPGALPSLACVELGDFASEAAARKARARLAEIGIEERAAISTVDKATRLRVTGIDAASEARIQRLLKDFPKQRLVHCVDSAPAR